MKYCEEYSADIERVIPHIVGCDDIYDSSVLITGGTGLICSSVVDVLHHLNKTRDADIKIMLAGRSKERTAQRFAHMTEGTDYTFVQYDATVQADMDVKADYIIHGASNANPAAYVREPVETMLANVVGLNNLLSLAVKSGVKRLLYVSSSEVYGLKENAKPYFENDYGFLNILDQRASYPSSKRAAETLCVAYGLEHGLDTVIVRPGHIYGPNITSADNRATAQFTRNAVNHEDIVMKSAGNQLRSYCYSLDCATAMLSVLLRGEKGNAYNISNSASIITISDIAKEIAKAAGQKVIYENPSDLEAKGYNLMSNSSLDSAKLEALGWSAEFSPQEGAERCVKLYS